MGSYDTTELGILLVCATNLVLAALLCILFYRSYLHNAESASSGPHRRWLRRAKQPEPAVANEAIIEERLLLSDMLSELSEFSIEPLDLALSNSMQLVSDINGLEQQQYPQWKQDNQHELSALLAKRDELETQLGDFKDKLARSHKLVTTLHGQNREMIAKVGKVSNLQSRQQQLNQELSQLREEHSLASKELRSAKRSLQDANIQLQQQRQEHEAEHQAQVLLQEHLRKECDHLMKQLEGERAVMVRTLVEKDFIETAFIETDAATDELRQLKLEYQALKQANLQQQATASNTNKQLASVD
jgi:hypothetical protein